MKQRKNISDLLKIEESLPEDSAVRLKDVRFSYEKERPCLRGVDIDIRKGEYVSIIGPNGSGKSTIAKLIDGILAQDSGKIYVFRKEMTDANACILRKEIGLVFQNPDSQFIGSTVKDDIAFGLENEQVPSSDMDEIIKDCASKVGMLDYLESEPSNLSGGQKQRIAIAGALARHPKVLILDEAGAMLDPKGKTDIRNIIDERRKEEKDLTIINITHEIDDCKTSDRVIVIDKGKVIMDGSPREVFHDDERLKSIGIDVPFAHRLRASLIKEGLEIPFIDDENDLLEVLCR